MKHFHAAVPNRTYGLTPTGPDQVWRGDVTYLKVGGAFRYLAVVLDAYTRRVVGWAYGKRRDVGLTLSAFERAVRNRRPPRGLIFHSDRGMEYANTTFKQRLARLGILQSMNRPGKMTDNAHIESFFHSLNGDVVHGLRFNEDHELRHVVRTYMRFYNTIGGCTLRLDTCRRRRMNNSWHNCGVSTKAGEDSPSALRASGRR